MAKGERVGIRAVWMHGFAFDSFCAFVVLPVRVSAFDCFLCFCLFCFLSCKFVCLFFSFLYFPLSFCFCLYLCFCAFGSVCGSIYVLCFFSCLNVYVYVMFVFVCELTFMFWFYF